MTRDGDPSAAGDGTQASQDAELGQILEAYLADREAGRPIDLARLLAQHPALAEQLRDCLAVMEMADHVADPSGSTSAPGLGIATPRGDTTANAAARSFLTTLDFGSDPPPHVQLRDVPDEREPLVKPRSAEMPRDNGASLGRFQLQGEIARGGMGAILRGRDVDLGRELAIKVMLESHQGNPEVTSRFVEEAQIGGQLQHPGVVPVYELGTFPDRRPYFAMKLVKGRTLAALLHERTDPKDEMTRFLAIFEQVCQTMAYAHARGVIHRDLKPSNVMMGSFGEVQVMDWGLAKVLASGGLADEANSPQVQELAVQKVRSGSAGTRGESQAGSVLGTPSYMAPEQARGDVDRVDERADVFGLGSILCEILTGRPPFVGSTREEIRAQAARGGLSDALARVDGCGADAELIALAKDCLTAERERRPRHAGELARRISTYQAGVQERLKAAELARVEAQAKAVEERKRRRLTVALASSVLVTAGLAGGGWAHMARLRQERAAQVNQALSQVEFLYADAQRAGDDLARWFEARDAARSVARLLADVRDEPTQRRVTALIRDATEGTTSVENGQKLLGTLMDIRSAMADDPDGSMTDAGYAEAFVEAGIDVITVPPAQAGAKILARPSATKVAIAAALDHWAAVRRSMRGDQAGARQLIEVARLADPDPWRNRLREGFQTSPSPDRLALLKDLAKSARVDELPAVSLHLLGSSLLDLGDAVGAESVLRDAQRRYPGDVWLNFTLARCLARLGRRDEAIRYDMAARSLRPETANDLAHALGDQGETDQAIAIFRELVRLRPKDARHLACLGQALKNRGRGPEADTVLEAAIAVARASIGLKPNSPIPHFRLAYAFRERGMLAEAIVEYRTAIRLRPDSPELHNNLGISLREQGNPAEAVAEFREALRLKPDYAEAHCNLGGVLIEQGKLDEAISEYREALRLKPDYVKAHCDLGVTWEHQGKLDKAIAEFREALRLNPDYVEAHCNLGVTWERQGKLDKAIAEFREALRLNPDYAEAHCNLGVAEEHQGKLDKAIAEFREAMRLKPDFVNAHKYLGDVLRDQGKLDEAIPEFREALRLKPDFAEAHFNLGDAVSDQGKLDEAIAEYHEAIRLKPDFPEAHNNLGLALMDHGNLENAIAAYREALRLKPIYAEAHNNLGIALANQGRFEDAIAAYREALRLKPDLAEAHGNLGDALKEQGKLVEAVIELREAKRLSPDYPGAHFSLGNALRDQGKLAEAIADYGEAIRLKPDYAEAHCNLGHVFRHLGRFADAFAELKRGHELGSKDPNWRYPSAQWVRDAERMVELDRKLPSILNGKAKPADAAETLALAQLCYDKKLHGASANLWKDAFRFQRALAEDMQVQNRYNATCAAALAGCGQGNDDPPLDEAAKSRWRKQAVDWLNADLAAWSKLLEKGPPQSRQVVSQTLQHWKADADLAGIRDAAALTRLPADEQKAYGALWAELDALLAKSRDAKR